MCVASATIDARTFISIVADATRLLPTLLFRALKHTAKVNLPLTRHKKQSVHVTLLFVPAFYSVCAG